MRIPEELARAFGPDFEKLISGFAAGQKLIPEASALGSPRFLSRSVVPHVTRLSALFNRLEAEQDSGLDNYWRQGSNPANLRLAYFLYFMPANIARVASVWCELHRLGFRWNSKTAFSGIELGAGPATGACGVAAGERAAPLGMGSSGHFALIEQDQATLRLGTDWASRYFDHCGMGGDWSFRPFHRTLDFKQGILPKGAPSFRLWLMSYFLNEVRLDAKAMAATLIEAWDRHLEDEGLVILCEPALKLQSRRLLELRRELLAARVPWLQVLTPCLGSQTCGALAETDDWCHEEVSWWRPGYTVQIDKMAGLDRKSLPFSHLVLAKSRRSMEELLPATSGCPAANRYRLVSPAHRPASRGKDVEFFLCGQDGKRRARYEPVENVRPERGDILLGADIRGDRHCSRVQTLTKIG